MTIEACYCQKCRHTWIPRTTNNRPHRCPNCKSITWDKAYIYKTYGGKPHRNKGVRRGEER